MSERKALTDYPGHTADGSLPSTVRGPGTDPPAGQGWQPIETFREASGEGRFWVVGEDLYRPGRAHWGRFGSWSALEKATHWMPSADSDLGAVPPAPAAREEPI